MIRKESGNRSIVKQDLASVRRMTPTIRGGMSTSGGGLGTSIAEQMAKRYTVNIPKGAYAVARDTFRGSGEAKFQKAPAWFRLMAGPSPGSADVAWNMFANEKFSDATAPTDFVGAGLTGAAKLASRIAMSKGTKFAAPFIAGGIAAGLNDPDTAAASVPSGVAKLTTRGLSPIRKELAERAGIVSRSVFDPQFRKGILDYGRDIISPQADFIESGIKLLDPTTPVDTLVTDLREAAKRAGVINLSAKRRSTPIGIDLAKWLDAEDVQKMAALTADLRDKLGMRPSWFDTTHGSHFPFGLDVVGHRPDTVSLDPGYINLVLNSVGGDWNQYIKLLANSLRDEAGGKSSKYYNEAAHVYSGVAQHLPKLGYDARQAESNILRLARTLDLLKTG